MLKIDEYFEGLVSNHYMCPFFKFKKYFNASSDNGEVQYVLGDSQCSVRTNSKMKQVEAARKEFGQDYITITEGTVNNFDITIELLKIYQSAIVNHCKSTSVEMLNRYGLPFWQDFIHPDYFKRDEDLEKIPYYGFAIDLFFHQVGKIYMLYRIWLERAFGCTVRDSELDQLDWMNSGTASSVQNHIRNIDGSINKILCVSYIGQSIRFSKSFNISGNQFVPIYCCDNYLDASILQMFDLIISGENALDKRRMSICRVCGNDFIQTHGNNHLCKKCAVGKQRTKRTRQRNRVSKKGQET